MSAQARGATQLKKWRPSAFPRRLGTSASILTDWQWALPKPRPGRLRWERIPVCRGRAPDNPEKYAVKVGQRLETNLVGDFANPEIRVE